MRNRYLKANFYGLQKGLNLFAYFMAFPVLLVLGQNFSLIIFIAFLGKYGRKLQLYSIQFYPQLVIIAFGIGAIISVVDINAIGEEALGRSLAVLPNFLYWSLLLIILINVNKYLSARWLSKYIFLGVVCSVYYYFGQNILPRIPLFINRSSANGFSFLLICFSAPAAIYILERYRNKLFSILFIIILALVLATEGRRAGTVLVFASAFIALFISKINPKQLTLSLILVLGFNIAISTEIVESSIAALNPRIYDLIYENENLTTEDRSYLVRRLMVEKASIIFQNHPLTGIGLNNFSNYEVNFKGDFEGSEFVADKTTMNTKSAHNSYIALLAEGGLLVLIPFLILLLYNFYFFVKHYNIRSQVENSFYWAFTAMCVHLYFISAILNVYAWFLIGIVSALSMKYKLLKKV